MSVMKRKNSIRRIVFFVIGIALIEQANAQHTTTFTFTETAPDKVLRVMEKNANALFAEINLKYDQNGSRLNLASSVVDDFARERIVNMWAVSHFYCSDVRPIKEVMKKVGTDTYQVRDIPIYYKEGDDDEYRYRTIVLEFDKNGLITDLNCSLPEHEFSRIDGNRVTEYRHEKQIKDFVDMFFTAYNCKDISLIEKMYSEQALIITGKMVNYKKNGDDNMSKVLTNNSKIEYSVQNKKEYVNKLRGIFSRNEYINIKFDEVEIFQSEANPYIYGVRLNQYWHVSRKANVKGYYDEGKLFLIIDFTNEEHPEIWVRTWQPFKDSYGNPIVYSDDDFFSIGDFRIR